MATHPRRHFLTGVMGGGGASVGSDLHHVMLKLGDAVVICTDGLTGPVRDEEIAEILRTAPSCDDAQVIALFRPPDGFYLPICAIIAIYSTLFCTNEHGSLVKLRSNCYLE